MISVTRHDMALVSRVRCADREMNGPHNGPCFAQKRVAGCHPNRRLVVAVALFDDKSSAWIIILVCWSGESWVTTQRQKRVRSERHSSIAKLAGPLHRFASVYGRLARYFCGFAFKSSLQPSQQTNTVRLRSCIFIGFPSAPSRSPVTGHVRWAKATF